MVKDEYEAQRVAVEYVASFNESDLKGWSYRFAEMSGGGLRHGFYSAVFDVYSPEGTLVDGPLIVLVRESDRLVIVLREAIEQGLIPLEEST